MASRQGLQSRLSRVSETLPRSILHVVRSPILGPRLSTIVALLAAAGGVSGCAGKSSGTGSSRDARVHRSCPPRDRSFPPSADPRTATVVVPAQPVGVLICRYWGRHDISRRAWTLAGHRYVVEDPKLNRLGAQLNALKPFPTSRAVSCPEFGGRSVLLIFRYRDASDDPVRVLRAGCVSVSNGRLPDLWDDGEVNLGEHWPDEGVV
jgi:hypothetical protein